jgi:glycosyltransferase involved in cell wall biosynthesis
MVSIVIAAHNEETVIGDCLTSLLSQAAEPLEVIVSANGCTDATAAVAGLPGVFVIDRPEPGKTGALNAAEEVATGFPRIYLDADIVLPRNGLARIVERFDSTPAPLAVVPRRRIDIVGRPWPVRAYFAINERLPVFRYGLFGRGVIALSAEGRARFSVFPPVIADDLFLDSQFSDDEKAVAEDVEVVVEAPFTTQDLLARLTRVRRGNAELRAARASELVGVGIRPSDRWSWFRDVVVKDPRLLPHGLAYAAITLTAALRARRGWASVSWGRDESTRRAREPQA